MHNPNPKRRTTISRKIMKRSSILVTTILILIFTIIFLTFKNSITKHVSRELATQSDNYQMTIENWVDRHLDPLNTIADTLRYGDLLSDDDKLQDYLYHVAFNFNETTDAYVGGPQNRLIDPTGFVPDENFIVANRDWFIHGLGNDTMRFGDPYLDIVTGSIMVSASCKIEDDTVLGSDFALNEISTEIQNLDVIGNGSVILLDESTSYIISHPNSDYIGQEIHATGDPFLHDTFERAIIDTSKINKISDNSNRYLMKSNRIEGTDWILITYSDERVIFSEIRGMQFSFIVFGFICLVVSSLLLTLLVKGDTAPIKDITQLLTTMTNGDYRVLGEVKGNDEITTMTEKLNEFILNMRHMFTNMNQISNDLNNEAAASNTFSDEMLSSATQQKQGMKQVNTTVEELSHSIEEVADNATTLANTISDVRTSSGTAIQKMEQTVALTEQGRSDISRITENIYKIDSAMQQLSESVNEVGTSSTEINKITAVIGEIAAQTNLLALNASIEAARAGDAGKGFAVVASEIGNLASSCSNAVTQIEQLIQKVLVQINQVVEQTSVSVGNVHESTALSDQTHRTFTTIFESMCEANALVHDVVKQIKTADEVAESMASITEEQSAGTEELFATFETLYDQSVQIEENSKQVKDVSSDLTINAEKIINYMKQFKF